jgi:hypothetical protein
MSTAGVWYTNRCILELRLIEGSEPGLLSPVCLVYDTAALYQLSNLSEAALGRNIDRRWSGSSVGAQIYRRMKF